MYAAAKDYQLPSLIWENVPKCYALQALILVA
jgi:hypothetical protein